MADSSSVARPRAAPLLGWLTSSTGVDVTFLASSIVHDPAVVVACAQTHAEPGAPPATQVDEAADGAVGATTPIQGSHDLPHDQGTDGATTDVEPPVQDPRMPFWSYEQAAALEVFSNWLSPPYYPDQSSRAQFDADHRARRNCHARLAGVCHGFSSFFGERLHGHVHVTSRRACERISRRMISATSAVRRAPVRKVTVWCHLPGGAFAELLTLFAPELVHLVVHPNMTTPSLLSMRVLRTATFAVFRSPSMLRLPALPSSINRVELVESQRLDGERVRLVTSLIAGCDAENGAVEFVYQVRAASRRALGRAEVRFERWSRFRVRIEMY